MSLLQFALGAHRSGMKHLWPWVTPWWDFLPQRTAFPSGQDKLSAVVQEICHEGSEKQGGGSSKVSRL